MSKNCIITTVKSKIKGNATSYIEKENEIFIPVSKKFSLNQTRVIAQDKVTKINKEYLSEKFGNVVSLNTSYTDGTGINIHPSQRLVDAYEVKEGNKIIQEVNTLSNRNIEYFNGEDALLVQDEDDRELKVQKELDKIVENINNIKFDENGQGLLFGNLQNLAKSNRIAVGEIKVENKKITGFNKKPNPYLRDYNTDLTEVQAKKLFEKTNKSTKDYEGLAVYFANMFVNEIIDKDVHLKMGYMRLAEYSQQKPKILITDTNKKINPFYQYNNTIIVGIYQLQQLLENGNYSDYQKFQNLIQSVAQEESIHLFAEYLLSKETVDNIYSEMSEKDIQKIKDIYENENLDKNGIVHEYVRMVVQQHVFNSTTEQEKVKLTNSVLDFISKMINEIQQFLSEIIGQNNTQKTIEDVINFTKGNFSEELDAKIKNKIFEQGVILEASLKREQTNNIKENETPASEIKEGVDFVFEQNSELDSIGTQQQYSQYLDTIFPDSKVTEIDDSLYNSVLNQLEQENTIEKDCSGGGKLKAKDGIATLFEKGGKWEIVTDFKNAHTHKSGGKDISIQGKRVEVEKNELRIENDFGDVAVIPSKYRIEVQDAIKSNCHSCIDGIVGSLPKMKDYAGDGTVFPFFGRYKRFKNSLPDNLKNTPEDEYAMRYYWKHSNKPKSFDEAINREQPMFTMEDDGYYHAPSVEPNTLRFLKPKNHPTLQYELDWYNSDNSDAVDFRSKYDLDTSHKFYRYVSKKK